MLTMKRVAVLAFTCTVGFTPLWAEEREGLEGGTAVVEGGCAGAPVAVVAHFLGLTPDQLPVLEQALRERQQTLAPILLGIAMREQRIRELVAGGGNPAEIGILVVQVHHLRQQAESAQAVFLTRVESLLDVEQRARWQQVRLAARLLPVLPAFQTLQVL